MVSEHPTALLKVTYDVTTNISRMGKKREEARLVRFCEPDFKTKLSFVEKWLEEVLKSHLNKLDYLVVV